MSLQVIKDPATIARAMRDTTEPARRSYLRPRSQRVRVQQYSGGWAVIRGDEVLGSHTSLTLALIHQMEAEGAA